MTDETRKFFADTWASLRRWRYGLYLVLAALVWDGFGWTTPAQQFAQLRAADRVLARREDTLAAREDTVYLYLRALLTLRCLDSRPRDLQLLQINCDLLTGRAR